ncbi:MAG: PspC domain-containing protein [Vallitalea sp.]|jgi:phage shock protein PspC (stress-responsive transcriptional regulator)|nr:PspC domain-containing protein [Vallitalea sp.]
MNKRLYRSRDNQMISGVCGGFAEYLGIDPTIIRILFVIALFQWGFGILAYIICTIIIPVSPISNSNEYIYDNTNYSSSYNSKTTRIIIGIFLVVIGVISILEKLFNWFDFDLIWPITLISIGFLILTKDKFK